jgi:hypothetical protein
MKKVVGNQKIIRSADPPRQPLLNSPVGDDQKEPMKMPKPPKATPHSDIDGVHQEEERNTDVAADLGQSGGSLKRAKDGAIARPEPSDDQPNREDRTG